MFDYKASESQQRLIDHLRIVNAIQEKCIKGEITKAECEQKLEIERLNYIAWLKGEQKTIKMQMDNEKMTEQIISVGRVLNGAKALQKILGDKI